jgi:phage FluMu protein Com
MVHVFCQNSACRMLIHLDNATYWNHKGSVKCPKCGTIIDVEVINGKVIYTKQSNETLLLRQVAYIFRLWTSINLPQKHFSRGVLDHALKESSKESGANGERWKCNSLS